jgi:hypothetical protein
LRRAFNEANSRYFGGRLEVTRLRIALIPGGWLGTTHRAVYRQLYGPRPKYRPVDRIEWHITINTCCLFSRSLCMNTLLHEMVHVEQGNKYSCGLRGRKFNNRMKELAARGAFCGFW